MGKIKAVKNLKTNVIQLKLTENTFYILFKTTTFVRYKIYNEKNLFPCYFKSFIGL